MVQEYLINDENERKKVSEYKPDGIAKSMISIENGACWYIRYTLESDNEKAAKRMSEVNSYVKSNFNVTVICNDCSEYFNNRLYPLMSKFERKLRKLLYVFSGIKKDNASANEINKLEEKNLGEIFTLLFTDDAFMKKVKEGVKNRNKEYFTKDEIRRLVEETEENTLWDDLLGNDVVPTLRACFQELRDVRNRIMHSRDIDYESYQTWKRRLKKINGEIDEALNSVSIKTKIANRPVPFGKTLAEALAAQEQMARTLAEMVSPAITVSREFADVIKTSPALTAAQEFAKQYAAATDAPEFRYAQEATQKLTDMVRSPAFEEAQNAARQIASIYKENPLLQQLAEQQRHLDDFTAPLKQSLENNTFESKDN